LSNEHPPFRNRLVFQANTAQQLRPIPITHSKHKENTSVWVSVQ
jgi:hypothetical protein